MALHQVRAWPLKGEGGGKELAKKFFGGKDGKKVGKALAGVGVHAGLAGWFTRFAAHGRARHPKWLVRAALACLIECHRLLTGPGMATNLATLPALP